MLVKSHPESLEGKLAKKNLIVDREIKDLLDRIANYDHEALMANSVTLDYNVKYRCKIVTAWAASSTRPYAMATNKHSPYAFLFDKDQREYLESGAFDLLIQRWVPRKSTCPGDENRAKALTVKKLITMFVWIIFSFVLNLARTSSRL